MTHVATMSGQQNALTVGLRHCQCTHAPTSGSSIHVLDKAEEKSGEARAGMHLALRLASKVIACCRLGLVEGALGLLKSNNNRAPLRLILFV